MRRGPLRVTVDEDGQARVKDRYVVSAPLAGSLGRIELEPGDAVRSRARCWRASRRWCRRCSTRGRARPRTRGWQQALAAQRQARVQIEHAQATFDYGTAEARRQQQLFDRGAGARQALDQAELSERRATHELDAQKFAARVADYEVEMARAALERMPGARAGGSQLDVPSPIDGRVLKVLHKSEGVVQPGTPAARDRRSRSARDRRRRAHQRRRAHPSGGARDRSIAGAARRSTVACAASSRRRSPA